MQNIRGSEPPEVAPLVLGSIIPHYVGPLMQTEYCSLCKVSKEVHSRGSAIEMHYILICKSSVRQSLMVDMVANGALTHVKRIGIGI